MVRGLFFKLEFPYAHFGTRCVTAAFLYPIVWDAIRLLEASNIENPNFQQCLHNAAAIRVQKSIATDPIHGNYSRKRRLFEKELPEISNKPLHKPKRH